MITCTTYAQKLHSLLYYSFERQELLIFMSVPSGLTPKQGKLTVFCTLHGMPVIVFFLFAS